MSANYHATIAAEAAQLTRNIHDSGATLDHVAQLSRLVSALTIALQAMDARQRMLLERVAKLEAAHATVHDTERS